MIENNSDLWETPTKLFTQLNQEFNFTLDLAANSSNYFTTGYLSDSLNKDWHTLEGWLWLNPPYSRGNINNFMQKVSNEHLKGANIVTLTRLDPSTDWFKHYVDGVAKEVRMLGYRPKFTHPNHSQSGKGYNFPCAVSIFDSAVKNPTTKYIVWK